MSHIARRSEFSNNNTCSHRKKIKHESFRLVGTEHQHVIVEGKERKTE